MNEQGNTLDADCDAIEVTERKNSYPGIQDSHQILSNTNMFNIDKKKIHTTSASKADQTFYQTQKIHIDLQRDHRTDDR